MRRDSMSSWLDKHYHRLWQHAAPCARCLQGLFQCRTHVLEVKCRKGLRPAKPALCACTIETRHYMSVRIIYITIHIDTDNTILEKQCK